MISPKRRSTSIFIVSTWTFHRIRQHWTNSVSVCAAGISDAKAEPDEESATNLKEKLRNETFEQWNETYNTDVTSVYFTTVAFLPLL